MVSDARKREEMEDMLDNVNDDQIRADMENKIDDIIGDSEQVDQDLNEEDQVLQKVKQAIEKAANEAQQAKGEADKAGQQLKADHPEKGAEIEQQAIKDDMQTEKIIDQALEGIEKAVQDELEEEGLINEEEQEAMELVRESTQLINNIYQELDGVLMNKTYGQVQPRDLKKTIAIMKDIKKGAQSQEKIIKQMKYTFQELQKLEEEVRNIVDIEELVEETTQEEEKETQFGEHLAEQMGDQKAANEEQQEEKEEKQLEEKEQEIEQMIQKVEQQIQEEKQRRKQLIQENQQSIQNMQQEIEVVEALAEDLRKMGLYFRQNNGGQLAELSNQCFQNAKEAEKALQNSVNDLQNAF